MIKLILFFYYCIIIDTADRNIFLIKEFVVKPVTYNNNYVNQQLETLKLVMIITLNYTFFSNPLKTFEN